MGTIPTTAANAVCWNVDDGTGVGTCVEFCAGTLETPICEGQCMGCWRDYAIALCMPTCDPLVQDCAAGHGCYLGEDTFACLVDESGEDGAAWTPCDRQTDCDPGLFCGSTRGVPACEGELGCCVPLCEPGDPSACAEAPGPGFECNPVVLAETLAGCVPAAVGVCAQAG